MVGLGCGDGAAASNPDAAQTPDVAMGAGGAMATGGVLGSGGSTGSPGAGGEVLTGGGGSPGGSDGSPAGVHLIATYDGQLHATWQNQTSASIFLYGCGTVQWSRLEGTVWTDPQAFVLCGWEGIAVEVAAGATFTETQSFAWAEPGRYRLSGRYGVACTPGLGLSSAGCAAFATATSDELVLGGGGDGGAGESDGDSTSGCVDVCARYGEACCLWADPCLVPTTSCTFDVLAASVGTTYQYADLETKVAALSQELSLSLTEQDIAWAAADAPPAARIELHLTDQAAARYGTVLDGARDGRLFRVSCDGQSLFVGVFYIAYGQAALETPVLHEARENGVLVARLGAYEGAWMGMGLTTPGSSELRQRIDPPDRPELRAALCRRGVLHVLDPGARPASP